MEENYIWNGNTCFYVDIKNKTWGCRINTKDKSKSKQIIKYFKNTRREQTGEQRRRTNIILDTLS